MSDKTANTITIGLITDTHKKTGYDMRSHAFELNKLCERVGAKAIIHLGDLIDGYSTLNTNIDRFSKYCEVQTNTYIPFLYTIGHHEMYGTGVADHGMSYYHTNLDVGAIPRENCIGMAGVNQKGLNVIYSTSKANWYTDIDGLRIIGLDSVDGDSENPDISFSNEAVTFLQNALSGITKPIIVVSHVPCLQAANFQPNRTIVNSDLVISALNNYSGEVLAYIHGHTHGDNYVTDESLDFPLISVCCGIPLRLPDEGYYPTAGNYTDYERVVGTYSEYCFDILNIHTDTKALNFYRFGAGNNRNY